MQVNLSWTAAPNALYYRIYRSTFTGGPYTLAGQSNPNPGQVPNNSQVSTTFIDGPANLDNGVDYFYVVSAVTPDGESSYSAEYHAVWPGAGGVVTGLTGVVS